MFEPYYLNIHFSHNLLFFQLHILKNKIVLKNLFPEKIGLKCNHNDKEKFTLPR